MSSVAPASTGIAHAQARVSALPVGRSDVGVPGAREAAQTGNGPFSFGGSLVHDIVVFFKLRVITLIVVAAWAGYYMGAVASGSDPFGLTLFHTLGGIGLASAGAGVLNQVFERRTDALMKRTLRRPVAAGRLSVSFGLLIGSLAIIAGSLWLAICARPITGILTFLTAITYACIYTPLKRRTTLATFIGAIPGAMPPLLGWVAVRGTIEWPAIALFGILFIWQFPHVMAITWIYREDYGRAGIRMLPAVEPDGHSTVRKAITYAILMIPASLVPYYLHMAGRIYWIAALVLGFGYLAYAIRFARITQCPAEESRRYARALLKASVIYLPLLLAVMMATAGRR